MSSPESHRDRLLAALIPEMAKASGQGVLFSQAVAESLHLNPTDLECLTLLDQAAPMPAGRLAELTGLTTGAITGVIDRLEKAGYVQRESDPLDRRRVMVQLIEDRLAGLRAMYEPLLEAVNQSLAGYSEHDLEIILDYFQRSYPVMLEQTARLRAETSGGRAGGVVFSAGLDSATAGRLEFGNGASQVTIRGDSALTELYRAHFDGAEPNVRVQDGSITIRYRLSSLFNWGKNAADVVLNPALPWHIELRGGASKVNVDARGLRLQALNLSGGAHKLLVLLTWPRGTVRLQVIGGSRELHIHRPVGVPAQVHIHGGASKLEFDGQRFGAVGGEVHLSSPDYDTAEDRYELEVDGGASKLTFDTQKPERLARWSGLPATDLA